VSFNIAIVPEHESHRWRPEFRVYAMARQYQARGKLIRLHADEHHHPISAFAISEAILADEYAY